MITLTKRSAEVLARRIAQANPCVLLDFDGTLVGLVHDPRRVRFSARTRAVLETLARRCPVGIISGRALKEIRKRVGIPHLWYAGNHGLEWTTGKGVLVAPIPAHTLRALRSAARDMRQIGKRFHGFHLEDKGLTLVVRFDDVPATRRRACIRAVHGVLAPTRARLLVRKKPLEYDIRPRVRWHKGHAARMMTALASRKAKTPSLPVFIGDDTTDEDAFRLLRKGITVRVGPARKSNAHYYFSSRAGVVPFLRALARVRPRATSPGVD